MRHSEEKKTFVDFSKTEEGKAIFEKNKALWKNGNYFEHIKSLADPTDIELAQIMRKYQSSFTWIHKETENVKAFQIRHMPTTKPEDLVLEFELTEGYLWLEIIVPTKYPSQAASFVLLNHSVPKDFKRLFEKDLFHFHIECRNILRTLKYMDNNLDKISKNIITAKAREIEEQKIREIRAKEAEALKAQKAKEAEAQRLKEAEAKIAKAAEKQESPEKGESTEHHWSQEQQKILEKAIVTFKDIKDPKEKWQKIAEQIPGKTMNECVQRFKECRRLAEEKKKEQEEHKINPPKKLSEEEEDEDDDDEDDEDEDSDEDSSTSEENKEAENVNRKIRDYQEYESCLDSLVLAKSMRLENVSTGTLISIQVQVSCQSCKCIHEAEAVKEPDSEYLINNDKCPKCGQKSRLVAKQEIFHANANAICSIGSFTWDIRDLHFCEFDLNCEFCDTANRSKKIVSSQPIFMECKGCFKKMQFSYMALTLASLAFNNEEEQGDGQGGNVKDMMKKMFAKKSKFEFKVGFPLPHNGSCKHYKNSNRYFRFPCCGKAYACDDCHNKIEKHEMENLAKSMICGFCSSEQPVGDTCKRCGKAVTKIVRNTAYWEGGKGTRNVAKMSNNDPHKYRGLGKTVSTKKKNKMKQEKNN